MLSKFFLHFSGARNLPKMTSSGTRNRHRMMISCPRNRHDDSAYILGPDIFILGRFLAPEIVKMNIKYIFFYSNRPKQHMVSIIVEMPTEGESDLTQ